MAEIIWTEEAERLLKEIYDYIAQDNPAAAEKVVSGIYQRAQILLEFPAVGYKYKSEPRGGYSYTSLWSLSYRLSDQGKRSRRYPRGIPRSLGYRSIPAVNGDGALLGILMVKKGLAPPVLCNKRRRWLIA